MAPLPVYLVAGLVYGMDFDRIKATLQAPDIQNVSNCIFCEINTANVFPHSRVWPSCGQSTGCCL